MTTLIPIPFHGGSIQAVRDGDDVLVAIRPVCEVVGLDYSAQYRRLHRQPWATVAMTAAVAADGKTRELAMVDRRTFTMWLATIDTGRIKSDAAREVLVQYQREAADALDRYFHEGGAINPRADEHQINALIFQSRARIELLQAARGLVRDEHLEAHARCVLAAGLGERAELDPATRPLYAQDYLREKNLGGKRIGAIAGMFGKRLKAAYIEAVGCPPERYPLSLGNGQVREVNAYTEGDRPLMDKVWATYYAGERVA